MSGPVALSHRKFRMPGFPYNIWTDLPAETVLAIAHTSRRPGYWLGRQE
jgi:hypothetical protein